MRGKGYDVVSRLCRVRITPACAGKRARPKTPPLTPRDHPRMCGEKYKIKKRYPLEMGSPPHVRGKGSTNGGSSWSQRITPACAGKRVEFYAERHKDQDHPRMCGEKTDAQYQLPIMQGSPPHVRGKVDVLPEIDTFVGITPACAGKRLKRFRSTVSPVAIVPLFPSVCNKPVVSDGSPAGRDAPLFLPAENAVPASPAYNLRSL